MDRGMSDRPLIGVTTSARGGLPSWLFNRLALTRAGARAVRLTADDPFPIERLDGLVIGGGDDISGHLYGVTGDPTIRLDPERDRLERDCLDRTDELGLPVLGICRGAQMINVHRGGSLHTDIYEVFLEAPRMRTVLPRKLVEIAPGSHLHRVLGLTSCRVNALHHQSVDRLGEGLRIVARDRAGIVQGIEPDGAGFTIGVQWHPEFLILDRQQQNLFRSLVDAARERRAAQQGRAAPASAADFENVEASR